MEKWKIEANKIDCLQDDMIEKKSLNEVIQKAKYILDMYFEDGNNYSADLNCEDYKDEARNKQVRQNAKNEIKQLKAFIKKYNK